MADLTLPGAVAGASAESCPPPETGRGILALDLGTTTGWALHNADGLITSGTVSFRPGRFEGGGMRYLRLTKWLGEIDRLSGPIGVIHFEEVRRHAGTDASHIYGGLLATLTAWAELRGGALSGRAGRHHQAPRDGQGQRRQGGDDGCRPRAWLCTRRRQRGRRHRPPALDDRDQRGAGMRTMRWHPRGLGGHRRDPDQVKRDGWREQRLLAVAVDDERLTWTEREFIRQLGERLYGRRKERSDD